MMTGAEGCRHIRGDAIESRRILCVRIDEIELHWTRLSAGPSSGEKDDKNDCDDDRQGSQSAPNAGTNFLRVVIRWNRFHPCDSRIIKHYITLIQSIVLENDVQNMVSVGEVLLVVERGIIRRGREISFIGIHDEPVYRREVVV